MDVCVQCSHWTHTIKLFLVGLPEGRRTKSLEYNRSWYRGGDLRDVPRTRVQKSFPFQELVDNLRRVLMPATSSTTSTTSTSTITTSSPTVIASPMAKPTPFTGVAEECNGILLQCSLYIEMQPHLYSTERSKVSFIISLLSGKALQWAEMIWAQSGLE